MRITQLSTQSQFLAGLGTLESNLAQTQNQISSNQSFSTAAQDPAAAGAVNGYNQVLAQSQQYTANSNIAQSNLGVEDSTLSQVQAQLQSLRDLALQANNGTLSSSNLSALQTQAAQIQQSLISLANTQNGSGEYIFSGYATGTQPFSATATGAAYAGDQGQRQLQIGAGISVADGDTGSAVFGQIKNGNGTFSVTAAAANTGSGLIGASTVTDPTAYDGGTYSIKFSSATAYQVLDSANNVVSSGSYTDGQSIAFRGVQVTLSGAPASGDSFTVAPSVNQGLFSTVQNLVSTLQSGGSGANGATQLGNSLTGAISNIDQALTHLSNVRASVGGRMNTITTQQSVASTQQLQLKSSISSLQSLDYAAAITTLDQQNVTLSAALQAYSLTQGLSLFKYL